MYLCIIWEFYILGGAEWLPPSTLAPALARITWCDRD